LSKGLTEHYPGPIQADGSIGKLSIKRCFPNKLTVTTLTHNLVRGETRRGLFFSGRAKPMSLSVDSPAELKGPRAFVMPRLYSNSLANEVPFIDSSFI